VKRKSCYHSHSIILTIQEIGHDRYI